MPKLYIFNPEHDLCLGNGDPNFVPPESALRFGRECEGLTEIVGSDGFCNVVPWGWDPVVRKRLLKSGVPERDMPDDDSLKCIRQLSHRGLTIDANRFILDRVGDSPLGEILFPKSEITLEISDTEEIGPFVSRYHDAVAKAPWSGSGKGLRWLREGEVSHSDVGWCRNTIAKQGSVILEPRRDVQQNFAMLYRVAAEEVIFEGYSLFFNDNGMYSGNVLASDDWIRDFLAGCVSLKLLDDIRDIVREFISSRFVGNYLGFVGVDMFVYKNDIGRLRLCPCVEINVRMTMGLLAGRVYDRVLPRIVESPQEAAYLFKVGYYPSHEALLQDAERAVIVLHNVLPNSRYLAAVFKASEI